MAKILLMEDDVSLAEVLCEVLAAAKHDVTSCVSASEALDHIFNEKFDLLITDIIVRKERKTVPDGGISLISRLRGALNWNLAPWMREMPIIAISGAVRYQGMADILKISRDLGADITLAKPTDMNELLRSIDVLLRK